MKGLSMVMLMFVSVLIPCLAITINVCALVGCPLRWNTCYSVEVMILVTCATAKFTLFPVGRNDLKYAVLTIYLQLVLEKVYTKSSTKFVFFGQLKRTQICRFGRLLFNWPSLYPSREGL